MIGTIYDQLRRDEGVQKFPYVDGKGKTTIGVGRNLTDDGVSVREIDYMLINDVARVETALASALPWFDHIDPIRQAVLTNMGFNLGVQGLLQFKTFLPLVEASKWQEASDDMLTTEWAREVGDRATRLAKQLVTGEWQ